MDAVPGDLQGKYQKLASEYSKMRAQLAVLKKAVLDEQGKSYNFQSQIKEKDQCNRKYEQEMESLTFRNQQLTKRISVLQEEFEDLERANKKGRSKTRENTTTNISSGTNVITEELQNKIEENVILHKKVHELDLNYQQQLQDLQCNVERLERDASLHEGTLSNCEEKNRSVIEKLTKDKARLELRLQSEEKTLREATMQAEFYQDNLDALKGDLSSKLSTTTKILHDKLLFNDTKTRELNSLNIPTIDCKQQRAVKKLVASVADSFKDLVTALSNFHTYNEQRITIFYEGQHISLVNAKLVEHLHGNASKLRPLRETFVTFQNSLSSNVIVSLETLQGFEPFFGKISEYIAYWNVLLPYHLLSLQEECALSSCSPSLEAKNMELYDSFLRLSRSFNKVLTYLEFISVQSKSMKFKYPESSQIHSLHLLSSSLASLHSDFKDVWKYFNGKLSLEHQLPTITDELKRTNECVLSSLISLVNCTGKISNLLDENIAIVGCGISYKSRGSSVSLSNCDAGVCTSPAVLDFQKRAIDYQSLLDEEEPESVPYEEALRNREILNSSTESREGLAKQLETMQDKVHKLEQAKEHWMLEFQLLEIKHERDLKKLSELEKQSKQSTSVDDAQTKFEKRKNRGSSAAVPLTVLGSLDRLESVGGDAEAREQEIKGYFTARINELVADMQLADSRAVTFQTECSSLQKKLYLAEKSNLQLQNDLSKAADDNLQLKEELQLTTKNYDGQLNTMSEHLANLNETLTSQKDEIDQLKYALKHKGHKKGKLK